ncbi:MAG TPA: glycosyltransferase family 2 protein [Paenibacillus sp.]|uniref:glycosyltransferase family 2 protein n=1 Tax=Paenibacillus sp. TaxID=58172 RepID=UPI002B6B55B9|nr:glycosyltransferase family 2 protein [Paenibacillus sp.]HUC94113.1 glycosyltransferase family 2 protein [Paenibacillus sp.]
MTAPRTTGIVIPTYNGLPLLRACVEAVRRHTDPKRTPYELLIVDNGSTDGTAQWCGSERISFIRLPANIGFPRACNKGLRLAGGERLLLLNNDVTVTPRWLDNLSAALDGDDNVGMAGPMTNYASGKQQMDVPHADSAEFERIADEHNRSDPGKWEPVMRLVGFCMLFKREVYERVGELDERFSPGHYEDDDYCLRMRMLGYGLRLCRDTLVHHAGSASFRQVEPGKLQALIERNRRLFMEKWNVDPAAFF